MRYIVNKKSGEFYTSYSKRLGDQKAKSYAVACARSIQGTVIDQDSGEVIWKP